MRTWEKLHQIIAFYQSYPIDENSVVSFMVTIRTTDQQLYHNFKHCRINPQVKEFPEDIIHDAEIILEEINPNNIDMTVYSTLINKSEEEKFDFYSQFLYPVVRRLKSNWNIYQITEYAIDLFSLQGLFAINNANKIVSEAINTVVYV